MSKLKQLEELNIDHTEFSDISFLGNNIKILF